jgi:predicted enzyme related to lactoylglutathione lyase
MTQPTIGRIEWRDLTVDDAEALRDFYSEVVGWTAEPVSMGDYSDYNMCDSGGETVAGICHARGGNADLPPQWLMYVTVADLDLSLQRCVSGGGELVSGPKAIGADRYCVIRDPKGAVVALYQKT